MAGVLPDCGFHVLADSARSDRQSNYIDTPASVRGEFKRSQTQTSQNHLCAVTYTNTTTFDGPSARCCGARTAVLAGIGRERGAELLAREYTLGRFAQRRFSRPRRVYPVYHVSSVAQEKKNPAIASTVAYRSRKHAPRRLLALHTRALHDVTRPFRTGRQVPLPGQRPEAARACFRASPGALSHASRSTTTTTSATITQRCVFKILCIRICSVTTPCSVIRRGGDRRTRYARSRPAERCYYILQHVIALERSAHNGVTLPRRRRRDDVRFIKTYDVA